MPKEPHANMAFINLNMPNISQHGGLYSFNVYDSLNGNINSYNYGISLMYLNIPGIKGLVTHPSQFCKY